MTNLLSKPNRLSKFCVQLSKPFRFSATASNNRNFKCVQTNLTPSKSATYYHLLDQKHKHFSSINLMQTVRLIHTTKPQSTIKNQVKVFYLIYNALQYAFVFTVAAGIGLFTGYYFSSPDGDENAQSVVAIPTPSAQYQPTKIVSEADI